MRVDEETSLFMITSNIPFSYLLRIGKYYKDHYSIMSMGSIVSLFLKS